jgi:pantothenate synthetase
VDPVRLDPIEVAGEGSVAAVAVIVGKTRLIDNLVLGASAPDPMFSSNAT